MPHATFPTPDLRMDGAAGRFLRRCASARVRARKICATLQRYLIKRIPLSFEDSWQRYWGNPYSLELKYAVLKPIFEKFDREGRIGNVIVDVGSGALPVTRLLESKPGRKRICLDIAADGSASPGEQKIRLDVEKVSHPASPSFRKALVRACRFLALDPKTAATTQLADTIVFSEILNYVDFRQVLRGFSTYLKPGGRIIVMNLPMRGNSFFFSDKGLRDNRELYSFLDQLHFEIEHKSFSHMPRNETDESGELIVLVARKSRACRTSH
jgi:hypothetical protein